MRVELLCWIIVIIIFLTSIYTLSQLSPKLIEQVIVFLEVINLCRYFLFISHLLQFVISITGHISNWSILHFLFIICKIVCIVCWHSKNTGQQLDNNKFVEVWVMHQNAFTNVIRPCMYVCKYVQTYTQKAEG